MNKTYKRILDIKYLPNTVKKFIIIIINWTFQSILYMDTTEKIFKLVIDVVFAGGLYITFSMLFSQVSPQSIIFISIILAHTLNWLINNNLFGLFKTFGNVITPREKFEEYIKRLRERVSNEPSIAWAGIYGSLVRGEFKKTSDLDVRLIRKPGLINGVRACIFVMKERVWANFHRFPLDIYVFDSFDKLKMKEKNPLIIYTEAKQGGDQNDNS